MNQAFNRVFTQEDTLDMPTPTGAPLQEELIQVQIHQERVRNCLNAVKENNVPGPDGVSPVILKAWTDNLSVSLTCIFQSSLNTGMIPAD